MDARGTRHVAVTVTGRGTAQSKELRTSASPTLPSVTTAAHFASPLTEQHINPTVILSWWRIASSTAVTASAMEAGTALERKAAGFAKTDAYSVTLTGGKFKTTRSSYTRRVAWSTRVTVTVMEVGHVLAGLCEIRVRSGSGMDATSAECLPLRFTREKAILFSDKTVCITNVDATVMEVIPALERTPEMCAEGK